MSYDHKSIFGFVRKNNVVFVTINAVVINMEVDSFNRSWKFVALRRRNLYLRRFFQMLPV